jgi:hypothetical protein
MDDTHEQRVWTKGWEGVYATMFSGVRALTIRKMRLQKFYERFLLPLELRVSACVCACVRAGGERVSRCALTLSLRAGKVAPTQRWLSLRVYVHV